MVRPPYLVALNVDSLAGVGAALGETYAHGASSDKCLIIDFSGSTFTSIPARVFRTTNQDGTEYDTVGRNLRGVDLPNSVTSIEDYAFAGCGITSVTFGVTIPSSGFDEYALSYDSRNEFYATDKAKGTLGRIP
jgi:hypothetical protein